MQQLSMIIFIGIQASGKTTFYHNYFKDTYEHVSLDVLNTRNKERLVIEHCIEQGRNLVIDNTNPTKEDRKKYITIAKTHRYQVIGYYFESSIGKCIERNEKRIGKAKVPKCAIISTSKKLELPDFREGFDKLYYVHMEHSEMKVEDWRNQDEISLLFHLEDNTFGRKVRKINTTLAGEASAAFSMALGKLATFDCRVIPLPNIERVRDYFMWRQEDAHRNSLNAYCYWTLRKEGLEKEEATMQLEGKSVAYKNEMLFERGINYNELPNWQKRGIGVYYRTIMKDGYNPVNKEAVKTKRRELYTDYDLKSGEDYADWVCQFLNTL